MTKSSPDSGKRATPADHAKRHLKGLALMGIALHDHLIVAGARCVSFKNPGHL
jgi:DNA repair protein RadC